MLLAVAEGLAIIGERDEAARLCPQVLEAAETGNIAMWLTDRLIQTTADIAAAAGEQWEQWAWRRAVW